MLQALRNLEAKNPAREKTANAAGETPEQRGTPTTIAAIVLDNPILRALHAIHSQSDASCGTPSADARETDRRQTDLRKSRPVETSTDHGDYHEHTLSTETVMLHDPLVAHDFTSNAWTEYLRTGDNLPPLNSPPRGTAGPSVTAPTFAAPAVAAPTFTESAAALAPAAERRELPFAAELTATELTAADLSVAEPLATSPLPTARREATALERAVRKNLSDAARAAPYRQLAERLAREIRPGNGNCLLFTGVGTQSTADEMLAHVAAALAEAQDDVLLVDADFARSGLSKGLGCGQAMGLAEVVSQRHDWRELLVATASEHLYLLPAGQLGLSNPAAAADELAKLLEQAERQFHSVLVDGGAAGDLISQALARLCDATYFVIRLGSTDAPEAQSALERYRSLGARVLGCVATNVGQASRLSY
jgi:Mrp family chromosome partitioning ATPase